MKKSIKSILAILVVCSVLFTACGQAATPSSQSTASTAPASTAEATSSAAEPAASGEKSTITVWTKDRHDQELMTKVVEQLNQEYDDMEVIYEMYTDNYPQTVEIAASTGELPDILVLTDPVIESLLPRNMLYFLDELAPADFVSRFDNDLFIENINMQNGKIFSFPNTGNTLRLVYNKDIFARVGLPGPPETMQQMVDYAKKITDELSGEGIYGFALPMKNPTSGFRRGITMIPQLSGYPVFEGFDFATGKYDFSSYKPAMEALTTIFTTGIAFPGCESLEIDPLRTQFSDGKIGMYMTYSHSEWGVYTAQFPTEAQWEYAVLPTYEGSITGSQKLSAGFWYAITTNCDAPEKAWRVMEAFYSQDNLVAYYEQGLGVSVINSVKNASKTPEAITYTPAMGIQPNDKIWPLEPKGLTVEGDDWGTVFGAIVFGARKDMDGAVQELNDRYNAAYEKGVADGVTKQIHYPSFKANDPAGTAK